jgi:hypothetical protein
MTGERNSENSQQAADNGLLKRDMSSIESKIESAALDRSKILRIRFPC